MVRRNSTMTPDEINEDCEDENQLEKIVGGIKEIQSKLSKIIELLLEIVDSDHPYNNNWADYYGLDENGEAL